MVYQKFGPAEILTPFVECYFAWESSEPLEKELVVESPPNGYCSIAINYGDPYFLQNKKYEKLVVSDMPRWLWKSDKREGKSSHSMLGALANTRWLR